ncbi:hypothetical protein T01_6917 [Trichinella spiralis]|uniref:Uncharacterized protein n=1 Tax=Trichinella spiralis TaxID=6334 RepID=A0A0V1BJM4_TRISP|nr:hypothetical protein T01_6917 [Trichinella spiralis]
MNGKHGRLRTGQCLEKILLDMVFEKRFALFLLLMDSAPIDFRRAILFGFIEFYSKVLKFYCRRLVSVSILLDCQKS